jgi:peptide/nickel transport system ATP-binding protein
MPPPLSEEIKSPIRPFDYLPPKRIYRRMSEGHFVQETLSIG